MFFEGIEFLVTTQDFPDLSYLHAAALLFEPAAPPPPPADKSDAEKPVLDLAA